MAKQHTARKHKSPQKAKKESLIQAQSSPWETVGFEAVRNEISGLMVSYNDLVPPSPEQFISVV